MLSNKNMFLKTVIIVLLFSLTSFAGDKKEGAITPEMLKGLEKSITMDAYTKAMMHAVANNKIKDLALNREKFKELDHHFAHKIETAGVTNQKSSGRCWLFTALNVLRPNVLKHYNIKDFHFSENYLFFYDQLEKSNLFLEGIINTRKEDQDDRKVEWLLKNAVGDGGVWNMMVDLVEKYGMVPKEAMPESHHSENTRTMNRLLKRKLREDGLMLRQLHKKGKNEKTLRKEKQKMLTEIYRILVISLGHPPKEFTWRYVDKDKKLISKTYTPMQFYKEVVKVNLRDYVLLMDDPAKEYYKTYEIEYDRNLYDGTNWTYLNLPVNEIKQFAKKSILADEGLYFSCDVGKQLNGDEGYLALGMFDYESVFNVPFKMNKKERILSFDSGSSHGMALMGVDTAATGKITKWLLENSWGDKKGNKGYLTMTDAWFDEYMFRVVVHKDYVSDKIFEMWQQKPIKLKPWDPMF